MGRFAQFEKTQEAKEIYGWTDWKQKLGHWKKCSKESDVRFKAGQNDLVGGGTDVGGCGTDLFGVCGGLEGWGVECRGRGGRLAGN